MGQQAHQETHPFHRHLVSKKNPIHSSCLVTKNKTNKQQKEKQALHHQPVNKQEKKKSHSFHPIFVREKKFIPPSPGEKKNSSTPQKGYCSSVVTSKFSLVKDHVLRFHCNFSWQEDNKTKKKPLFSNHFAIDDMPGWLMKPFVACCL